jgi:hypothetical protein
MHLPLPFCVLAFATIGGALSPRIYLDRLALTYAGILLALCLGAYSLDELHGRPYHTQFSNTTLWILSSSGIAGGLLIGIYLALTVSMYILILAAIAIFFIVFYNLELLDGIFHNAASFGLSWGGISTFGGYYVQAVNVDAQSIIVAGMASVSSVAILYLTHKFRPREFSRNLHAQISQSDLTLYSRESRKIAWTITKLECYTMILLALGMIIPKLL